MASFDDIIKKKLEKLDTKATGGWQEFKNKLDAANTENNVTNIDSRIDSEIKSKLANHTIEYNQKHWLALKAKLKQRATNLENLYVSKSFEMLTFILLLLAFMQNGFFIKKHTFQEEIFIAEVDLQNPKDQNSNIPNNESVEVFEKTLVRIAKNTEPKKESIKLTFESDNRNQRIDQTQVPIKKNAIASLAYSGINTSSLPTTTNTLTSNDIVINEVVIHSGNPPFLPRLYASELDYSMTQVLKTPTESELYTKEEQHESKKLGTYLVADNFLINTPPDQVYKNIDEVLFNSVGYGGGISYDIPINKRIELGAGLEYSSINYSPQEIKEVFLDSQSGGVYSIHLDDISYNILSIPLKMKMKIAGNLKWSIFSQFGFSTYFISNSTYNTEVVVQRLPAQAVPSEFDIENGSSNGPRLFQKAFPDGIAEGGQITDNMYFTANLGLGFSKTISDRVSLFSLLNYKSNILDFGVGPNNDKLNAISFSAGAQYSL